MMIKVNTHIHTPYSFSAFNSIDQAFDLAKNEGIQVLGINDFFVTDGYQEFNEKALEYGIYPLFNIEFIGLLKEEQDKGTRVNDPSNPGRTYFCGKALRFPVQISEKSGKKLAKVIEESQVQLQQMVDKLNIILNDINSPFSLSFDGIKEKYAKELVRERHIAQALRNEIHAVFNTDEEKKAFLRKLYSGEDTQAELDNNNSLEGELRGMLLKAGGAAFVPEDASSFLPIAELSEIILDAGGIPCYPVLLDDKNGSYTEFEGDFEKLYERLSELNVWAVELIPGRNKFENLKRFVEFFHGKNFLVSFGTEHNTPDLAPLEVKAGSNVELDSYLLKVNEETACILAAHQERIKRGEEGYLNKEGAAHLSLKGDFIEEGKQIFKSFFKQE